MAKDTAINLKTLPHPLTYEQVCCYELANNWFLRNYLHHKMYDVKWIRNIVLKYYTKICVKKYNRHINLYKHHVEYLNTEELVKIAKEIINA